jgi:hypothetical protein
MLFRPRDIATRDRSIEEDANGVIAIPQPSHSWLSGQLVRAWGNERFARPAPFEEVCLGAALHDIGWLGWEAEPTLNPATGLPHNFLDMKPDVHTRLWTNGVRQALAFGRYPALLVSLHAKTIYTTFFDFQKAPPDDARLIRSFLAAQEDFQRDAIEALSRDPMMAPHVAPEAIERNRRLVAATDRMSLEICWGITGEVRIPGVPTTGGEVTELSIRSPGGDPADLTLSPWPFAESRVEVFCEGSRLRGQFSNEGALREALSKAERATIRAVFNPS